LARRLLTTKEIHKAARNLAALPGRTLEAIKKMKHVIDDAEGVVFGARNKNWTPEEAAVVRQGIQEGLKATAIYHKYGDRLPGRTLHSVMQQTGRQLKDPEFAHGAFLKGKTAFTAGEDKAIRDGRTASPKLTFAQILTTYKFADHGRHTSALSLRWKKLQEQDRKEQENEE
jgi:hypothetical protein